jgi:hypothetical protein
MATDFRPGLIRPPSIETSGIPADFGAAFSFYGPESRLTVPCDNWNLISVEVFLNRVLPRAQ